MNREKTKGNKMKLKCIITTTIITTLSSCSTKEIVCASSTINSITPLYQDNDSTDSCMYRYFTGKYVTKGFLKNSYIHGIKNDHVFIDQCGKYKIGDTVDTSVKPKIIPNSKTKNDTTINDSIIK